MTPEELTAIRKTLRMTRKEFCAAIGLTGKWAWQDLEKKESGKQNMSERFISRVNALLKGPCPLCGCERRMRNDQG